MKSKYFFLLFLILIIGLGSGFLYQKRFSSHEKHDEKITKISEKDSEGYPYLDTTFFAPVTGLKNKKLDILSTELITLSEIYSVKGEKNFFSQLSSTPQFVYIELDTIASLERTLNISPEKIGVLPIHALTPKVKTLSIDGQFIFDRNVRPEAYPLKLIDSKKSNKKQQNNSNFSLQKLTKIGHTGSMIPARGVQYWTERSFKNDYTHIFKPTKPLFDTFDHLSATFESPVNGTGQRCDKCMAFVGPEKFMEGVKYSGIDFFTMASNHIMDGGVAGLTRTQKLLEELEIEFTGASVINNDDAGKPVLKDVNGLKVAYLGFNDTPGYEQWANDNKPGAAAISDIEWDTATGSTTKYEPNIPRIKQFIKRAKDLNPDLVIVLMHWGGREYVAEKLEYQKKLADLLLENGADMILGDHVHWVQEMEFVGDKPVFYGVGNYIFDQMWSIETRQGMTIELNFYDKKLVNFRLHPHQLHLYEKGTVELLKPEQTEYQQVIDRVMNVSQFGTGL